MEKWMILFVLLSLMQQNVDGCKKKCKSKRFKCPIGTQRHGHYDMPTYEKGGNCYVIRGNDAKDRIARNCWPEEYNLAKKCIDVSGLDCSGPAAFQPLVNQFFEAACYSHDLCYRTKFNAPTKSAQHHCDNQFYDNMRASCDSGSWFWFGTGWLTCKAAAWAAYLAVWDHGTHHGGGCWLNRYHNYNRNRNNNNATIAIDVDINAAQQLPEANTRQQLDDFDQSYKEFQGRCWDLFGSNTAKIWNDIKPLMNRCKTKNNKRNSVNCWRKIKKNLKKELENEKVALIECVNIEGNTKRINIDTVAPKQKLTREDRIMLTRSDLFNRAKKSETELLDLEEKAIDMIEQTWEQNERNWNQCWKKSVNIARKKGIEMAEEKIQSCWKMDIEDKIKEELSIST